MKIRPVTAELFHADGRTDGHDEANSRFSLFLQMCLKGVKLLHSISRFSKFKIRNGRYKMLSTWKWNRVLQGETNLVNRSRCTGFIAIFWECQVTHKSNRKIASKKCTQKPRKSIHYTDIYHILRPQHIWQPPASKHVIRKGTWKITCTLLLRVKYMCLDLFSACLNIHNSPVNTQKPRNKW